MEVILTRDPPDLALPVPKGRRAVSIHGLFCSQRSATLYGQLRSSLADLLRQLVAQGTGPQHLERLVIHLREPCAAELDGRWLELTCREVLGGGLPRVHVCTTGIPENGAVAVSALALVPVAVPTKPVYRGYSAVELDRLYSPRATVPDALAYFERWRQQGEVLSERLTDVIVYGDSPWESMDLFVPAVTAPPLHFFLHGGYWQAMDKLETRLFIRGLLDAGVAAAVVNYPLCPEVRLPEITASVREALARLWAAAPRYGIDNTRVQIGGHSAGAHLAAELLATDWGAITAGLARQPVTRGVLVSGIYDLTPLQFTGINRALGLDPVGAYDCSPVHRVPGHQIDLVLAWGTSESEEFERQSRELAAAWGRHGANTILAPIAGTNHFSVIETLADPGSRLLTLALEQLAQ